MCVCVRASASLVGEASTNGYKQTHKDHSTYIHDFLPPFLSCETIFLFLCTGDEAHSGACDCKNHSQSPIFT